MAHHVHRFARLDASVLISGNWDPVRTTYEEAPARPGLWLRQRTRWMKGWMQTWAVHMRSPLRLWRELGTGGFVAFQLVLGGNVLAALMHACFLCSLVYVVVRAHGLGPDGAADAVPYAAFYGAAFFAGYLVSVTLGLVGLARRGLLKSAWALSLVTVHWILLSLAAWRALFQLAYDPYGWEKTAHGLGRSSRHARMKSSAALDAVFRSEPHRARSPPRNLHAWQNRPTRRTQAGIFTTASKVARSGASSDMSRSSRATMPIVTLGRSGSNPGVSTTSGGGRIMRGIGR